MEKISKHQVQQLVQKWKSFPKNKAKKTYREAYKNLEEKIINGYSIVVLLKKDIDINDMKYIDIINEMENTFKKANIIS